jgi:hypothetical protein
MYDSPRYPAGRESRPAARLGSAHIPPPTAPAGLPPTRTTQALRGGTGRADRVAVEAVEAAVPPDHGPRDRPEVGADPQAQGAELAVGGAPPRDGLEAPGERRHAQEESSARGSEIMRKGRYAQGERAAQGGCMKRREWTAQ